MEAYRLEVEQLEAELQREKALARGPTRLTAKERERVRLRSGYQRAIDILSAYCETSQRRGGDSSARSSAELAEVIRHLARAQVTGPGLSDDGDEEDEVGGSYDWPEEDQEGDDNRNANDESEDGDGPDLWPVRQPPPEPKARGPRRRVSWSPETRGGEEERNDRTSAHDREREQAETGPHAMRSDALDAPAWAHDTSSGRKTSAETKDDSGSLEVGRGGGEGRGGQSSAYGSGSQGNGRVGVGGGSVEVGNGLLSYGESERVGGLEGGESMERGIAEGLSVEAGKGKELGDLPGQRGRVLSSDSTDTMAEVAARDDTGSQKTEGSRGKEEVVHGPSRGGGESSGQHEELEAAAVNSVAEPSLKELYFQKLEQLERLEKELLLKWVLPGAEGGELEIGDAPLAEAGGKPLPGPAAGPSHAAEPPGVVTEAVSRKAEGADGGGFASSGNDAGETVERTGREETVMVAESQGGKDVGTSSSYRSPFACFYRGVTEEMVEKVTTCRDNYAKRRAEADGLLAVGAPSFSPTEVVEELARVVLDEIVSKTAEELLSTCDSYVEQLFEAEFLTPSESGSIVEPVE